MRSVLSNVRFFTTSSSYQIDYKRVIVEETDSFRNITTKNNFKARHSPTQFHIKKVSLPDHFYEYAKKIFEHENLKALEEGAQRLASHLRFRQPPIEEDEYESRASRVEEEIKSKDRFIVPFLNEKQQHSLERSQYNKIRKELRRTIYHWEPVKYDHRKALQYLIGRMPGEYAALNRVFFEIVQGDPYFAPSSMLDFGSGTGSVLWAAQKFWGSSLTEHLCVDASREMNDIAELLIRRGVAAREPMFKGVHFRQFLSAGTDRKYDFTTCSFSLLDLPSAQSRMDVLHNLWRKTRKYLVILEPGSNAGFEVLNEARDFLLQTYLTPTKTKDREELQRETAEGHVFAPCPHDMICPRYALDTTPCNFHVKYRPLLPFHTDLTRSEIFSFVVLKKGPRSLKAEQWPRFVRDPLPRGGHVICRLCTNDGNLAEAVLTKRKHLRSLYMCARRSLCGDLLPVREVPQDMARVIDREVTEKMESRKQCQEQSIFNEVFKSRNDLNLARGGPEEKLNCGSLEFQKPNLSAKPE